MSSDRVIIAVTAAMLVAHPTAAQDHRFEVDPVVTVRENFVACDVLSQLQRVMDNPRFLLPDAIADASASRFLILRLISASVVAAWSSA